MVPSPQTPETLEALLSAVLAHQAAPVAGAADTDAHTMCVLEDLKLLARLASPRPEFMLDLQAQLFEQPPGTVIRPFPSRFPWHRARGAAVGKRKLVHEVARGPSKWWKPGLALGGALLLSLIVAGPVLGQVPLWRSPLKHVSVHEGEIPAVPLRVVGTPPSTQRWSSLEDLSRQAGFKPLLPRDLPAGCKEQERWYAADVREVELDYGCAVIAEQLVAGSHQQPRVGAGSTQQIILHGKPAIYVEGAWVGDGVHPFAWVNNGMGMILYEDQNLVIRVTGHRPKDVLARIAESILQ